MNEYLTQKTFQHFFSVISKSSLKITVLRDPVKNFESGFGFFRDYPWPDWLGNDRKIETFLENPDQYYNKSTPWYFRAKNYMGKFVQRDLFQVP